MWAPEGRTEDGFETHIGVNHLGSDFITASMQIVILLYHFCLSVQCQYHVETIIIYISSNFFYCLVRTFTQTTYCYEILTGRGL